MGGSGLGPSFIRATRGDTSWDGDGDRRDRKTSSPERPWAEVSPELVRSPPAASASNGMRTSETDSPGLGLGGQEQPLGSAWCASPRCDAHFPPVLGQGPCSQGQDSTSLPDTFRPGTLAPCPEPQPIQMVRIWLYSPQHLLCLWPHRTCKSDVLAPRPTCYQEAVGLSVRSTGLVSADLGSILAHLPICVCDLQCCLISQAFRFSLEKWG